MGYWKLSGVPLEDLLVVHHYRLVNNAKLELSYRRMTPMATTTSSSALFHLPDL